MAVIQYSALLTQMRGKLGGSQFNKTFNGYSLQRKASQPRRDTPLQSAQRQRMQLIQRLWKEQSQVRQSLAAQAAANNPTSDRFGQQVILSGYQQYVKMMLWRALVGYPLVAGIVSASSSSRTATPTSIGISYSSAPLDTLGTLSFTLSYSTSGLPSSSMYIMVFIRRVGANNNSLRSAPWLFVGSLLFDSPSGSFDYVNRSTSQVFVSGTRIALLSRTVNVGNGASIYEDVQYLAIA